MKYNTSYIKSNLVLGLLIACFLLLFNVVGCFGQQHINIPLADAVAFNKKVMDLLPGATLQDEQQSETAKLYNYTSNGNSLKVVYYVNNNQVTKIAVKGSKDDIQHVFNSYKPDAGKQFVLTTRERIYIEKQTENTWALIIVKR